MMPRWVAGVDGCRAGWVVAFVGPNDEETRVRVMGRFADIFVAREQPCLVAIDIPIGLPAHIGPQGRGPERAVRPLLGDRQSSVFAVPSRGAVYAQGYGEACRVALATSDPPKKVSKQLFMIAPKIREVDETLRNTPSLTGRVFEVHPEVAFWRLNGGRAQPQTIFLIRWPARRSRNASWLASRYLFRIRRCATNSDCRWRSGLRDSRSLLLGVDQLAIDQALGDLNRVEGRALAQIVGNAPQHQPVVDSRVFADTADIGCVLADALIRRDVAAGLMSIDDQAAWRAAQDGPRFVRGDRPFELDIDRLRMADEHRHPYAGGDQLDLRVKDFLGLRHHLPFFLGEAVLHEHVDVGNQVEGDAPGKLLGFDLAGREHRLGLVEQLVHGVLAGARYRLVGGNHHPGDFRVVVQGLEGDHKLGRRAVRIGNNALLAKPRDRIGVYLGNDQRDVGVHTPTRGIVDHDRAARPDARRPLLRYRRTCGHQTNIHVGEIVMIKSLNFEGPVPVGHVHAHTFARGQGNHLVGRESALGQYAEHFAAHIAGGADDSDLETHLDSPTHLVRCRAKTQGSSSLLVGNARQFNDGHADRLCGGARGSVSDSCRTATMSNRQRQQIVAFVHYRLVRLAANVGRGKSFMN